MSARSKGRQVSLAARFCNQARQRRRLPAPLTGQVLDCISPKQYTEELVAKQKKYSLGLYARPDIVLAHGRGAHVYDVEGRRYLDFAAGIAVNALGYSSDIVTKALGEQANQLLHASNLFHTIPAIRLAEQICESSFADKVFFANSGTEANEGALKFARLYGRTRFISEAHPEYASLSEAEKKKIVNEKIGIVSFTNAFHGRTMGALSATPAPKYQAPFAPLIPGVVHGTFNDVDGLDALINEKTCGVIVEPIQGEGGIYPAKQEFLTKLRHLCDKHNALLIFDEIQCGLGRTGKLFAYENFGILPDVLTMAKPLANGVPIGAVLLSEKVASQVHPGDHGTTFGGNPLACHVAEVVFSHIKQPAFLESVKQTGAYLTEKLKHLQHTQSAATGLIKEVRAFGLMVGVELTRDPSDVVDRAREQGLIIIKAGVNTIRIVPPLIITREHVDEAVAILAKSLSDSENK